MDKMKKKAANFAVAWMDRFIHGLFYFALLLIIPALLSFNLSNGDGVSDWLAWLYYVSAAVYATYMSIRYGACEYL